jgi:hypothetical protein
MIYVGGERDPDDVKKQLLKLRVGSFRVDFARSLLLAHAPRVPAAPTHASEALTVRRHRPLGSPLMGRDASLGFRNLSLQGGHDLLCFAGRTGHLANRESSCFEGLHGVTVLLELNPVPSDVAIAVGNHMAAPASDL